MTSSEKAVRIVKMLSDKVSYALMQVIADDTDDLLTRDEIINIQELAGRILNGQATDADWEEAMDILVPYDTEG